MFSNCTTIHRIPLAAPPQTNVVLKENNFKMLKKVTGEWSATYILGLGGTSREALASNSVAEMIDKAQLKDNQALINTTTAVSTKYIFGNLYTEITAVSTGYVIEFASSISSESTSNPTADIESTNVRVSATSSTRPSETQSALSKPSNDSIRPLKNKLPDKISSTYESFRSGRIHNMSKRERESTERAFISEIEADLENAKTMDDLDIINTKIAYLDQYSLLQHEMKTTVKRLKDLLNNKLQYIQ